MLLAHRSGDAHIIAAVTRIVVIADFLFTATAVIVQPMTGLALIWHMGYGVGEHWIVLSIVLYLVTGVFWLPVVWIQNQMRLEAQSARDAASALSARYRKL